jgi:hypothetical protein
MLKTEPYVLLFSCMYTNGSKLTSQWKCTPGLNGGQMNRGERSNRKVKHALDTPIVPEVLYYWVAEKELGGFVRSTSK